MPDGQRILSGSNDAIVRVWRLNGTAPSRTPSSCTPHVRALVALPDNQHALSGSARQLPSSSSTSTTAPSCAPSGPTQPQCSPWRCCPTASASSAARMTAHRPHRVDRRLCRANLLMSFARLNDVDLHSKSRRTPRSVSTAESKFFFGADRAVNVNARAMPSRAYGIAALAATLLLVIHDFAPRIRSTARHHHRRHHRRQHRCLHPPPPPPPPALNVAKHSSKPERVSVPVPAYEIDEHERGLAPWKGEVALPGWRESHAPLRYVHHNVSNASNATANATRGEYNSWRSFSGTRTAAARRFALRGCGAAATHAALSARRRLTRRGDDARARRALPRRHSHRRLRAEGPAAAALPQAAAPRRLLLCLRRRGDRARHSADVVPPPADAARRGVGRRRVDSHHRDGCPQHEPRQRRPAVLAAPRVARVPKMLPHRLFPRANYSLWIDGKLRLFMDPVEAVQRFLVDANSILAAPRNLRRDTIDEGGTFGSRRASRGGEADPLQREPEWMSRRWAARTSACGPARKRGPSTWPSSATGRGGRNTRGASRARWARRPPREGDEVPAVQLGTEYSGHSERDQLAFAYVHFMMGMGPRGRGRHAAEARAARQLSRRLHQVGRREGGHAGEVWLVPMGAGGDGDREAGGAREGWPGVAVAFC